MVVEFVAGLSWVDWLRPMVLLVGMVVRGMVWCGRGEVVGGLALGLSITFKEFKRLNSGLSSKRESVVR